MLTDMIPYASALMMGINFSEIALPIMWFGVILLSIAVEGMTTDLVAIWFAPGAFIAMILAFLNVHPVVQVVVFVAVAVLCLVLTRTVFKRIFRKHNHIEKTNADSMVGKQALVVEDINNQAASGVVKINGQLWTARMSDPTLTPVAGEWVEIEAVQGSKLICKPKK